MEDSNKNRILLVDTDQQNTKILSEFLEKKGFNCTSCSEVKEALFKMDSWKPQVVICDLLLSDGSAYELIKKNKDLSSNKDPKIKFVFLSAHNKKENVEEAIKQGVSAYMVKPFNPEELLKKIIFLFRDVTTFDSSEKTSLDPKNNPSLLLYLSNLLLKQALSTDKLEDKLFKLNKMLSLETKGVRASIIHCLNEDTGVVVQSSDDKEATGIELNLSIYPEVLYVKGTSSMIVVKDLKSDPNLSFIKNKVKSINFNSLIVSPLWQNGIFFGVLSLKLPEDKKNITKDELRFIEIVSNVISLTLTAHNNSGNLNFWLDTEKIKAA